MDYRDYRNEHCEIAAQMLSTDAELLDYRLIERLNRIAAYVKIAAGSDGKLRSRQIIALAIVQWQEGKADDFTGDRKS